MNKISPQNIEVEEMLLGCIIIDPKSIISVIDLITPEDFYSNKHQIIYRNMLEIFNSGESINIVTLKYKLETKNKLSDVGGTTELMRLQDIIVLTLSIKRFANIIKDLSIRRQLLNANRVNENIIYDENEEIEGVLASVQNNIFKINKVGDTDNSSLGAIKELETVQKEYAERFKKGELLIGYKTGFDRIDSIIDGIRPGHIWAIGAFRATGKTQFVLNIVHALLEQQIQTTFLSLEMSRVDLMARLIGIRNGMSSAKVLKGFNDKEVSEKINEGKEFFKQAPLTIHNNYFELDKIKMAIRKDFYLLKTKVFVLDYIQNIISSKRMSDYEIATTASIELQALARELGVTIIMVSQISNEAEKGGGAGAGLKGSGAIEAVADIVIRLKRKPENEKPEDTDVPILINVNKNRHGLTGYMTDYELNLKSGKFNKVGDMSNPKYWKQ